MQRKIKKNHMHWEDWYALARKYYREHGDLRIPRSYVTPDGSKLGRWIERQRAAVHGKGTYAISEDQIRSLDRIGMQWCLGERKEWDFWYQKAEEFYREHGNLLISKKCSADGYALGNWIGEQRRQYQEGRLKKERQEKLEAISMEWCVRERRTWEEWYLDAVYFKRQNGNLDIPFDYRTKEGNALGSWIERQRENYWMTGKRFSQGASNPLTEDRIYLLERLGMKWTSRKWKAAVPRRQQILMPDDWNDSRMIKK